jgi:SGT1 protein
VFPCCDEMIIEFTVHFVEPKEGDYIKALLKEETKGYLFEQGPYWFRSQGKTSRKLVGVLDCAENEENAWFLTFALAKVTTLLAQSIVRISDISLDRDFLYEETVDERQTTNGDERAFLVNGFAAVAKISSDELTSIMHIRNDASRFRSPIRTEYLGAKIDIPKFHANCTHRVALCLPHRLACAIEKHPELVGRVVFAFCNSDGLVDEEACEMIKSILLDGSSSKRTLVRFTMLSYATLLSHCGKDKTKLTTALGAGFARVIHANDDFEARYERYKKVVLGRLTDPEAYNDAKAREALFGTKGADDDWASHHNLKTVLERVSAPEEGTGEAGDFIDDDDSWLQELPDDQDASPSSNLFDIDEDAMNDGDYELHMPSSSTRPILFSSNEFMRILAGEGAHVAGLDSDDDDDG